MDVCNSKRKHELATDSEFSLQFSQRRVKRRLEKQQEEVNSGVQQGTPSVANTRDPRATALKWKRIHDGNTRKQQIGNKEHADGNKKKWFRKYDNPSLRQTSVWEAFKLKKNGPE